MLAVIVRHAVAPTTGGGRGGHVTPTFIKGGQAYTCDPHFFPLIRWLRSRWVLGDQFDKSGGAHPQNFRRRLALANCAPHFQIASGATETYNTLHSNSNVSRLFQMCYLGASQYLYTLCWHTVTHTRRLYRVLWNEQYWCRDFGENYQGRMHWCA